MNIHIRPREQSDNFYYVTIETDAISISGIWSVAPSGFYEFEPSWFADVESQEWYECNWESINNLINEQL